MDIVLNRNCQGWNYAGGNCLWWESSYERVVRVGVVRIGDAQVGIVYMVECPRVSFSEFYIYLFAIHPLKFHYVGQTLVRMIAYSSCCI